MRQLFSGIFDESEAAIEMHGIDRMLISKTTPSLPNMQTSNIDTSTMQLITTTSAANNPTNHSSNAQTIASSNAQLEPIENSAVSEPSHILIIQDLPTKYPKLVDRKNISDWLKHLSIYDLIKEFRLTLNKNLLIYTNDQSKNLILEKAKTQNVVFLDIGNIQHRKTSIVIKGSFAAISSHMDEIKEIGIVQLEPIVSRRTGEQTQFCIASVKNSLAKESMLNNKYIYINKKRYYVEEFKPKKPKQCQTCKSLGHNHDESKCPVGLRCARCGENHKEDQCSALSLKCINCGGKHSTFYKGCPEYQKELSKIKTKSNEETAENTTVPSAMPQVENGQISLVGAWKSSSQLSSLSAKILEQAKDIQNNANEIESLSQKFSSFVTSQEEDKRIIKEHSISILDIVKSIEVLNKSVSQCANSSAKAVTTIKASIPRNLVMTLSIFSTIFPDANTTNEQFMNQVAANYAKIYNETLNISEIKSCLAKQDGKQN